MPNIATINGIAEDNIATHNGGTAALYTSKNGDTWVHFVGLAATGGTITTDGNYKVHTFNSGATFQVTTLGHAEIEYLVLAGGGGGSSVYYGGAGGGGGYRIATGFTLPSASGYVITIGGGGSTGPSFQAANSGVASVFDTGLSLIHI